MLLKIAFAGLMCLFGGIAGILLELKFDIKEPVIFYMLGFTTCYLALIIGGFGL